MIPLECLSGQLCIRDRYNTADSIIVGNFVGSNALAAVGSSGSPIYLLIGFSQGLAVGAGVVVSQYLGAGDHKETREAVHTSLAIAVVMGLLLTVGGVACGRALLVAMNTPAEVLADAVTYIRTVSYTHLSPSATACLTARFSPEDVAPRFPSPAACLPKLWM